MATDPWGIDDGYFDVRGEWHATSPETRTALREAMTGDADRPPEPSRPLWVVRAGAAEPLLGPCELRLEDGTAVRAEGALPPDLPIGYHDLHPLDGGPTTRLIVVARSVPPARRPPGVDPHGPAARLPIDGELGHRRPRRPALAGDVGGGPRRRDGGGQPAPRPPAGRPRRAQPVLPVQPSVGQPAGAAHRGRAGGRRRTGRGGAGRPGPPAQRRPARWTATRCGRSSGGRSSPCGRPAGPTCGSTGGAPRWAPTSRPTRGSARSPSTMTAAGTGGPRTTATPITRRWRRSRRPHADRVAFWAWVQFLARRAAAAGRGAVAPAHRPRHRRRSRRGRRLGDAGPAGPRRAGRGPARRVQPVRARTGACRRSCPTPCATPATPRSPACGPGRWGAAAACASTT